MKRSIKQEVIREKKLVEKMGQTTVILEQPHTDMTLSYGQVHKTHIRSHTHTHTRFALCCQPATG